MRKYIVNLTDNLIGTHHFDVFAKRRGESWDTVLKYIKTILETNDVHEMNPETLGKIMCNLEIGDVMASKKNLTDAVHFSGDCEEMLRELVALCLAYVIRDRLDPLPRTTAPPYGDVVQMRQDFIDRQDPIEPE